MKCMFLCILVHQILEMSYAFISVWLDRKSIVPKENFSIVIQPIRKFWHGSSVFHLQSEWGTLIKYSPMTRWTMASNNYFQIIHSFGSDAFTINGTVQDYEEQNEVKLDYIEGFGVKSTWSWIVALNTIADITLSWNHVDYIKKGRPSVFENDVIRIQCQLIGAAMDNYLIIKLPSNSKIMFEHLSVNQPNYRSVHVKMSREVYGKAVICYSKDRSGIKINWEILKFRYFDSNPEVKNLAVFLYFFQRGVYLIFIFQMAMAVYVLVFRQRHMRIDALVLQKFDSINSQLELSTKTKTLSPIPNV